MFDNSHQRYHIIYVLLRAIAGQSIINPNSSTTASCILTLDINDFIQIIFGLIWNTHCMLSHCTLLHILISMEGTDLDTIADWTGQSTAIGDKEVSRLHTIRGSKCAGFQIGTGPRSYTNDRGGGRARGLVKAFCTVTVAVSLVAFLTHFQRIKESLFPSNVVLGLESAAARFVSFDDVVGKNAADSSAPLLRVFQVYPPVLNTSATLALTDGEDTINGSIALANTNDSACSQTLVVHSFAYSYGHPYIGVSPV